MFQFPGLPFPAYVFSWEHARITTRRFSHSEIAGSKVGQHLPRAYRSRPRPSSALGAKASTVCSCSLDPKEHVVCRYGVFKVRSGAVAQEKTARGGRSLKTQQRFSVEVDLVLGDLVVRTINETVRSSTS